MCDFIGYSVTWIGYFGPWRTFTSGSLRHAAREKQVAGERVLIRSCRLHALTSGWQFCVLSATHAVGQRSSCLICKSVFDRLAAPLKITYVCVCVYLFIFFAQRRCFFLLKPKEHARGNKIFNWLGKRCRARACVMSNNAKRNWVRASVAACTHLYTVAAVNEREKKRGSGCLCEWMS